MAVNRKNSHMDTGVQLCIGVGKTGTTWSPCRVAQPPADCRMLVHGLHFTLTPVLMNSLLVPVMLCYAVHSAVCSDIWRAAYTLEVHSLSTGW